MRNFDFSVKTIVVGDSGVGKTCLLLRFIRDVFDESSQPTLGVEFMTKTVQTKNHKIELQLWDTAGQELFRSVTRGYYRNAVGAFLVFDLTQRSSFENISRWLQDITDVAKNDVIKILIGNKCDLESSREISTEEAKEYAEQNGMVYFETSAKSGENVSEAINECLNRIESNPNQAQNVGLQPSDTVFSENESKKGGCC